MKAGPIPTPTGGGGGRSEGRRMSECRPGSGSSGWRGNSKTKVDMINIWARLLPDFIKARLEGRSRLQKVIGNAGWLLTDQLVRMGVGLFLSVWVARYLGPSQFGNYSYAVAFVSLFSILATLGLDGIVVLAKRRRLVRRSSLNLPAVWLLCSRRALLSIFSAPMTRLPAYWWGLSQ